MEKNLGDLGLDLGLDSGKNFWNEIFEILGVGGCGCGFWDVGSRLWERESRGKLNS